MRRLKVADYEKGFNSEVIVLDKGESLGEHRHMGNVELIEVLSGVVIVDRGVGNQYLRIGDVVRIPIAEEHGIRILGERAVFILGVG